MPVVTSFARLALGTCLLLAGCQLIFRPESIVDPSKTGSDYARQGEYASSDPALGLQVVALGDDAFRAVLYQGGLPGDGWDGSPRQIATAEAAGSTLAFSGPFSLRREGDAYTGTAPSGTKVRLAPVERESPTLGAPPPPGAIVVFDGSGTKNVDGTMDARGLLEAGATSRSSFRDLHAHVEFRTPFTPGGRGQFRGNSGVYLQDRYEVQVLDSFGLPEKDNDCGGIYQVSPPLVNMSYPPLRWQTYDIDFKAARFDADGEKIENARITVRHNGVLIQDDVELPDSTGGGDAEEDTPGPLYLQNHFDPVVYRNVWVVDQDASANK